MTLWLSAEDLVDLCGLSQPAAQRRWLESYGIRDIYQRSDGSLRVPRYHFEAPREGQPQRTEPNFAAIRRVS